MRMVYVIAIVFVILSNSIPVFGGGHMNPYIGASSMGMGMAVTARADDLTAIYYNPAGLAQQKGSHFMVSPRYIMVDAKYQSSFGGPIAQSEDPAWVGFAGFSTDLNRDDLVIGVAMYTPFGLNLFYGDKGFHRYSATSVELKTIYFTPTIAYQVNEKFSVGAGINITWVDAELQNRTNPFLADPGDANFMNPAFDIGMTIDGSEIGIGGTFGLRYVIREDVTWGFMYIPEKEMELEGDFQASIPPALLDQFQGIDTFRDKCRFKLTFPHQIKTGVLWNATDRLGLELDFSWLNWASFESIDFNFENKTPLTQDDMALQRNWDNSIMIHLGAEYAINDRFSVRGGYMFDQTPIPDETLDPVIPDSDKNIFSVGGGYRLNNWEFDFAYSYLALEKREITTSINMFPTNGTYETSLHIVLFSMAYEF